ncbi:hypothetical protein SHELI_v1c08760 [Spiroplasma helicoides]|uniref:Lipoprotein n=1 Tax=Spiroplasma helicoides TaxID=216938 RepID=A0A1B3SLL0_9MOLU|nr:lipoprotein [Spiroplasma helicoides]AOG60825.1 hypothetical protein SHELI_v1c08760 [Spiroplasma helicoides]
MKKLLSLLAATGLVASSSVVAVSCKTNDPAQKTEDTGKDTNTTTKTDLSKLTNKDLGLFSSSEETPSLSLIVEKINEKNASYGLTSSDVEFDGSATASKAKIKAKTDSQKFTGSVEVTYTYDQVKELTYADSKKESDLIAFLKDSEKVKVINDAGDAEETFTLSKDNSLVRDYSDYDDQDKEDKKLFGKLEGVPILIEDKENVVDGFDILGNLKLFFNETKSLKGSEKANGSNENQKIIEVYLPTIKGKKGEKEFSLNIIKINGVFDTSSHKLVGNPEKDKVFSKVIRTV